MGNISIASIYREYSTFFVKNFKSCLVNLNNHDFHVIIDKNIFELYQKDLKNLEDKSRFLVEPIEKNKNFQGVFDYIKFLLKKKIKKDHKIVVIGGGLTQDIGSFSAHILLRGIEWVFFPTTLLSMADSCIGSKSGINIGKYKNQLGAFNPPSSIYIYTKFLKTLPEEDILNGIGEIIKHGLIAGPGIFSKIRKELNAYLKNKKISQGLIYRSLLIKKRIVEKDELETKDLRKLLNYGHSFGHALEGFSKNKIPHGIAVTVGIDMANFISTRYGLLPEKEFKEISKFLYNFIPYKKLNISEKNIDIYVDYLARDKKFIKNKLQAILCKGIGKIEIVKIRVNEQLKKEILNYIKYFNTRGFYEKRNF